jgi:RNA polymerase sigma-B factor
VPLALSAESINIRERTTELFQKYSVTRDVRIRNKIVNLNAGLVHRMARKYSEKIDPAITTKEECVQIGFLGLIKAVERFDNSMDGAFVTFAGKYIQGELMHYNRDHKGLIKIPSALTEERDKILKHQRTIQKLRPDENVTIEYVLNACPQLRVNLERWQELEHASKPQHYAPIDCQSDDDVFVQIPADEQNTLTIEAEKESLSEQQQILRRRILYALNPDEKVIVNEYMLGVPANTIAKRNRLTLEQVETILQLSILKLKTC